MNHTDTSSELRIQRVGNGIKLMPPKKGLANNHTVSDILKLPFQVYFENREQVTCKANEIYAEVCGFETLQDCIGTKWFRPFKTKTILPTINNDKEVVTKSKYIIVEEAGLRKDETEVHTLSIRMPWYNDENKTIGLFGFSISLGRTPLADSLLQIANLGLLNPGANLKNTIGCELNNIYLSRQQLNCAKLILKGMTAKDIATYLHLSIRTVETYTDIIKTKLRCNNKTELILKLSELFK